MLLPGQLIRSGVWLGAFPGTQQGKSPGIDDQPTGLWLLTQGPCSYPCYFLLCLDPAFRGSVTQDGLELFSVTAAVISQGLGCCKVDWLVGIRRMDMKRPSRGVASNQGWGVKAPGRLTAGTWACECPASRGSTRTRKRRGLKVSFVSLQLRTWHICQGHTGGHGLEHTSSCDVHFRIYQTCLSLDNIHQRWRLQLAPSGTCCSCTTSLAPAEAAAHREAPRAGLGHRLPPGQMLILTMPGSILHHTLNTPLKAVQGS